MTPSGHQPHFHRDIWQRKAVLRAVYNDMYGRMAADCRPGRILEVGGGSGNFKAFAPDVVSSDVQLAPWLDLAADAQILPFAGESFGNIVIMDVLHHIAKPRLFLAEAARILNPGGRLILMEPAITPVSWGFYHWFHPEPVDMSVDPLADGLPTPDGRPYDANQGLPTLLFGRHLGRFQREFPEFHLVKLEWQSLLAYPLSGGFRPWSLIPKGLVGPLLRIEDAVAPWLGRLAGFRLFAVVERR